MEHIAKKPIFQSLNFGFIQKINIPNLADENSLQISNLVYETIDDSKLGSIPKNSLQNSSKATIKNTISRDLIYLELKLNPIIKDQNSVKRLKSFSYTFTIGNLNRLNQAQNLVSSVSNSVLSSGTWYRFYVQKSGVYIINKTFLEELGVNTNFLNSSHL